MNREIHRSNAGEADQDNIKCPPVPLESMLINHDNNNNDNNYNNNTSLSSQRIEGDILQEFLPLEPAGISADWSRPIVRLRRKEMEEDRETFPPSEALHPNSSDNIILSEDCSPNTSSASYDHSSNTTDVERPESRHDQGKRMNGDINIWEFLHPAPSDFPFEDMSESDQLEYKTRLEESISRLPSPDAFSNTPPDNYHYEDTTTTTDIPFSLPSLNANKTKAFRTFKTRRQAHAIASPLPPDTILRIPYILDPAHLERLRRKHLNFYRPELIYSLMMRERYPSNKSTMCNFA